MDKKYRFYRYRDSMMGYGDAGTLCFITATTVSKAWEKLISYGEWSDTPHMVGNIEEVDEFKQPDPIPVI